MFSDLALWKTVYTTSCQSNVSKATSSVVWLDFETLDYNLTLICIPEVSR